MSSIGKLMKQVARAQQDSARIQAELAARSVEATVGGGAVKVTAKCDGNIVGIKLDPQALNPADAQMLEDMLLSAIKQVQDKAREIGNAEMSKLSAGMGLPGM
jgi:DNA-binding YbaB/EbfC family protein